MDYITDDSFSIITLSNLGKISEVVPFHLQIENFGLSIGCLGDEEVVKKSKNVIANVP